MSSSTHPTFPISNLGLCDGMDTVSSITVASNMVERRSLTDLRGSQGALSMKSSLDQKDGSLGRSSIRRCMLAKTAPRQILKSRSKTSGTSIVPSWEGFRNPEGLGNSDVPLVRRASTDVKPGHKLQLPPFQTLGIAAPHPDYFCTRPALSQPPDPPRIYPELEDAAGLGLHDLTDSGNKEYRRPNLAALQLLTPPDDSGTIDWRLSSTSATDPTKLAPCTALRPMPTKQGATFITATHPGSSEGDQPSDARGQHPADESMADSNDLPPSQTDDVDSIGQSLLEQAISITG